VTDFITAVQTVQVESYRSDAQDSHGNDIDAWAPPGVPQQVYGWGAAGSQEVNGWRSVVTSDVILLAPPDFHCEPKDHIVLDGVVYEVQGDPQRFNRGPFDFDPGVSVNLKHVEGAK
jgi:hypothetical protein